MELPHSGDSRFRDIGNYPLICCALTFQFPPKLFVFFQTRACAVCHFFVDLFEGTLRQFVKAFKYVFTCYLGKTGYLSFHQRNPNCKSIFPSKNLKTGFFTTSIPRIINMKVKIPLCYMNRRKNHCV